MSINNKYEAVIGLEVHAQLSTESKLFCGDSFLFGAPANTQVSVISLGHPGTLPRTNNKAIEYAIKMGLACNCEIESYNYFARKNYFYPDLPKGYQISQHTNPICKGGFVEIKIKGERKQVQLNRIHLEEDAGKSIHDADEHFTCLDYNRAGTPLIEIVTEPCIHSGEEAYEYLVTIRKLVRWLGICDGNMEEGSLRCDANISIRVKGTTQLGTKVEVKNLNSIRNVKKAIEVEVDRMIKLAEDGEKIIQQTRSFDATTDTTFALRDKEEANDYRYFPDPDLAPFIVTDDYCKSIKASLPALPQKVLERYQYEFGLSEYDAIQLTDDRSRVNFFEAVIQYTKNYKAVANWMTGPVKQYLNERNLSFEDLQNLTALLAELIELTDAGKVSFSVASSKVLPLVIERGKSPYDLLNEMNMLQVSDLNEVENWVDIAINTMPDKVEQYKKGKKGLLGLFVGEVKKLSKGKADPKLVSDLLQKKLNS